MIKETKTKPILGTDIEIKIIKSIAKRTPYREKDISDFMHLTGLKIKDVETTLITYSECGVTNMRDINIIVMLGNYSSSCSCFNPF